MWTRFQTYGQSSEKSFEMLCNQLFENWCREEYGIRLLSFHVVNGSGGDGGVESYAVLNDGIIIGLQAKWFCYSIVDTQIKQIKSSIMTAKRIRPQIKRYIVCVPRDLTSDTGRGKRTESKRWDTLINEMRQEYPDLRIELWSNTKIVSELQKPSSAGILKFWFANSEFDQNTFLFAFQEAKNSWLLTKYVPDVNVSGEINGSLMCFVGDFSVRENIVQQVASITKLCASYAETINAMLLQPDTNTRDLKEILFHSMAEMNEMKKECEQIIGCLMHEITYKNAINEKVFEISFETIIEQIKEKENKEELYFHFLHLYKILNALSNIDYVNLLRNIKMNLNQNSLLFLGNPGTGKTQGVSAFADKLFKENYHIPIMIQARGIPEQYSWRNIIIQALGLSESWSEEELWQALISVANRNRFQEEYIQKETTIIPKILIIVDGLDESSIIDKWIDRINETEVITKSYPIIRFCFTSRPVLRPEQLQRAFIIRLREDGDTSPRLLFDIYARKYKISIRNCQWIRYALNTPLALKLFCEIYEGKDVSISDNTEISISELWRKKIDIIQTEFNRKTNVSSKNQYILSAIRILSESFAGKTYLERDSVLYDFVQKASISDKIAESVLDYLESYGIIGSIRKQGIGINLDTYEYYIGIQGYFDYATSMFLLDMYKHPSEIDFTQYKEISNDTLYCLAIICIQRYQYLITANSTIKDIINCVMIDELQFYALRHADLNVAEQYQDSILEYMLEGAYAVTNIVNQLVLPLSRIIDHPLGVTLLDKFLLKFANPAQRDIYWSLPPFLPESDDKKWKKVEDVQLLFSEDDEYYLNEEDTSNGIPMVYAWMLSNVNNDVRKKCRNALMIWAEKAPYEYFELFMHFSMVNDPQIVSDLYSILMCIVYTCNDEKIVKESSEWILNNVLDPSIIDRNRDISIRYYSIAIVYKAILFELYSKDSLEKYLPPYITNEGEIALDQNAFAGTRMGGYSAIDYDLARYVLVDHFEGCFENWRNKQLFHFIQQYSEKHPNSKGITTEQFIISAAYAYIKEMGWNENEFYKLSEDTSEKKRHGADISIRNTYYGATHGAQSRVMTVCEKYIWVARNVISGFLSDRLLYGEDGIQITDYSVLENFKIPIQDIHVIDPENIPITKPWYIPEKTVIESQTQIDSKESLIEYIHNAPEIDWIKWVCIDNRENLYRINQSQLLALYGYSCLYDKAGIETCLFINSIIIPIAEVEQFISRIHDTELFDKVCNPDDWDGGCDSYNYTSPREMCWFSWKRCGNSMKAEYFPDLHLHSAVDSCYYSSADDEEISFHMPSSSIRSIMGIVDTDGYLYFDKEKQVIAEYTLSGKQWGTTQQYVLVNYKKLDVELKKNGQTVVLFLSEMRRESETARKKYGKFFAKRTKYSIAYYNNDEIKIETLITEKDR